MTRREISIDDHTVAVLEEGDGRPLLVLHDELGDAQWRPWLAELARERRVVMPLLPGFGSSPQVEWILSVRDLACFTARTLRAMKLDRLDVIGLSFGGWLAAEMAVNRPETFARLVLAAPFGIKPRDGEIRDLFLMSTPEYMCASVRRDESAEELARSSAPEEIEEARAGVARIAWSPYMHNPSLPHLLRGVTSPAMIVWGADDAIIPSGTALQYREAMPSATVAVIADCGHHPEVEASAQFVAMARKFFSTDR